MPHFCRVPRVFRTWYHQVGAKWRASGFPSWRGMRTTLVSGSQSLNEVETFPRHHEQRRASPCTPGPWAGQANRYFSGTTASRSCRSAPRRAVTSLWSTSCSLRSSRSRNSSSVMSSAVSARSRPRPARRRRPDLARALIDEGGQLPDVLRAGLAADRVLLPQDLDVDPLLLCHGVPFLAPLSRPGPAPIGYRACPAPSGCRPPGPALPSAPGAARQLGPIPLRGPQLGLEAHHLGLQRIALLAQARMVSAARLTDFSSCSRRSVSPSAIRLLRHAPRTSARNRWAISATIRACTWFTSASVRVRSGAWNVRLQARLRRPRRPGRQCTRRTA